MSMARAQQLAAQSIAAVADGKNLQDVLADIRAAHPDLTVQENGALQDIAYGVQRYAGSLRFMLAQMLNKPINNAQLESLLLAAMYQLHHTRNAPHAVVNEAVESIAKIGKGQYRAFANAICAAFCASAKSLPLPVKKTTPPNTICPNGGWIICTAIIPSIGTTSSPPCRRTRR